MKAIAAMDPNRVIGNGPKIPWHYSEDFKHFKKTTINQKLLMGRKTFDAIGKPLPNRFTYVLTTDSFKIAETHAYHKYVSPVFVSNQNEEFYKDLWVCGGAEIYTKYLPHCTEVVMTHIIDDYEGDVFMPEFEHLFPITKIELDNKDFRVVRYSRLSKYD